MHMKNRQHVQKHVVGPPAPEFLQDLRIRRQIAMRQHGAFATSRGARRIQNGGQVVRLALHGLELAALASGGNRQTAATIGRSEDLQGGNGWGSTGRTRGWPE